MPEFKNPESRSGFPTEWAGGLESFASKQWRERLALFSEVKNKVEWLNPEFPHAPFRLKEGEPSPLGVFVEDALRNAPPSLKTPSGKHLAEVWPEHIRTALLGRVVFQDLQGRKYRDLDLKGVGVIVAEENKLKIAPPGEKRKYDPGRHGLLDLNIALYDRDVNEAFLRAGIRAPRVLAIIQLEELIAKGKKVSLEEARTKGILDEKFTPAVEIRAFTTEARIRDLFAQSGEFGKSHTGTAAPLLLEDARDIISQELGENPRDFGHLEYLSWFAEMLGRNVALMHKNGWYHGYLTEHNITLDCRILDFDSVEPLKSESMRIDDESVAESSLRKLSIYVDLIYRSGADLDKLSDRFLKSYNTVFPQKERLRVLSKAA